MMATTMKGLVCVAPGCLELHHGIPIPEPAADEVLIKIIACGMCHTDLHISKGEFPCNPLVSPPFHPLILGHEGTGEVIKLGANVTNIKIGARVGVPWLHSSCGHCEYCLTGFETLCLSQTRTGFSTMGCFAEYTTAKSDFLIKIPDNIDIFEAAPLMCAGLTSYKAIKETNSSAGEFICILGSSGGLGHLAIQFCKAMGFIVVALTHDEASCRFCQTLSADFVFDLNSPDWMEHFLNATPGKLGAHSVINFSPNAASTRVAINILRPKGTLVQVGLPAGDFQCSIFDVVIKRLTIRGSIVGTREDAHEMLGFVERGMIKSCIKIQPIESAVGCFTEMERGQLEGRVVLKISTPSLNTDYLSSIYCAETGMN